MYNYTKK